MGSDCQPTAGVITRETRELSTITVKGVINSTVLRIGEEATVERTDNVDQLIELGYLREVHTDTPTPEVDHTPAGAHGTITAPSRSASKAVWFSFLQSAAAAEADRISAAALTPSEDETRAELINRWDAYLDDNDDNDIPRPDDGEGVANVGD